MPHLTLNRSDLAAAVRTHRGRMSLRTAEIASGVSAATLSRIERGAFDPDLETMLKLCGWMDTDPSAFIDGVGDIPPTQTGVVMGDNRAREIYFQERVANMQRTVAAALYLLALGDAESAEKARRMLVQLVPELYEEPENEDD